MFDWEDYLSLAHDLATGAEESRWRTAVSRAYYAAFHVARRHVEKTQPYIVIPVHGGAHRVVWDALRDGKRQERTASLSGGRLLQKRTKADYKLQGLQFPQDADFALAEATSVIRSLKSLSS